jgi:hypothetical protein
MDNAVNLETKYTLRLDKDLVVRTFVSEYAKIEDLQYCATELSIDHDGSLLVIITKDF